MKSRRVFRSLSAAALVAVALFGLVSCGYGKGKMSDQELTVFATRYSSAWSSQDPDRLALLYGEDGRLQINAGEPAVGRAAIAAKASEFMTAFPNMMVEMVAVGRDEEHVIFEWRWTGTNTGPGGTGRQVEITGYEEWTFGPDGLIVESKGHFDEAEYQRQMGVDEREESE